MDVGRPFRAWRRRLAALMRRLAASLEGGAPKQVPPELAPARETGPPAHWLERIARAGNALAWTGRGDSRPSDARPNGSAASDSISVERDAADGPRVVTRRDGPRDDSAKPAERAPRRQPPLPAVPRSFVKPPPSSPAPQDGTRPRTAAPASTPWRRRLFGPPRIHAVPPPELPRSSPVPHEFDAAPPRFAHESARPAPPAPPRLRPVRAAFEDSTPRAPAPPNRAASLPPSLPSSRRTPVAPPIDFTPAPPFASIDPFLPSASLDGDARSNHRSAVPHAPRVEPPRRRHATGGAPDPATVRPPWPALARRESEGIPPAPPAAAPWPELPVREDEEAERSLEELERSARIDALAAGLGDEPWNASPF